jgi:hypothetical protein
MRNLVVVLSVAAAMAIGVGTASANAPRFRYCFDYASSGWWLGATTNVSCKTARHVMNHMSRTCRNKVCYFEAFRCTLNPRDAGVGPGSCTASRRRRIRWNIP